MFDIFENDPFQPKVLWPEVVPEYPWVCRFESHGDGIFAVFFKIHHVTPKGVVISVNGKLKYIKDDWKKRFAHSSLDEAFNAFIYRRKKQIEILSRQLQMAKDDLELAIAYQNANDQEII